MNTQQEKQLKKRNAELENKLSAKNRELEIESALEKVRVIALGMKEPADMLAVCKTISLQLQSLGVKEIRNVQTAIFYQSLGTYMNYEYYAKHKKTFITETCYTDHEIHKAFAARMLKGKDEFIIKHIKGKKVKEWIAYQKTTNVFIDRFLEKASSLNYYWYSLGPVALGISTYVPLIADESQLFKRFVKVFELAYRRYMDIELAIIQAREARIEASLERVRAVAMGMNKPEDLLNVSETLYREFHLLGFPELRNSMINIHNDEKKTFVNYDYSDEMERSINHLAYNIHPLIEKQIKQIRSSNDAFSETVFEGDDLKTMKKFRKQIGEKDDPRIKKAKALYYYFYSIGTGSIGISTFKPIFDDHLALLKRFRNVFSLSYQRYTDISLAESQARESQIELGLERVRARAMAMQKSDELAELVNTVFKELTKLDFSLKWCIINIIDENSMTNTVWAANPDIDKAPESYYMKFEDYPYHHAMIKDWRERKTKSVYTLEGQEKKIYDDYLFSETEFKRTPETAQAASRAMSKYVCSFSFSNFGGLQTVGEEPLSDENLNILSRFGKVFDLTYTRFNDLQRAEAQAREAKIEAALESVRASSMAMHHSEELEKVVKILSDKLIDLGLSLDGAFIFFFDKEKRNLDLWIATNHLPDPIKVDMPYDEVIQNNPIVTNLWQAIETGRDFINKSYSGKVKDDYFRFVSKYNQMKIPEAIRKFQLEADCWTVSLAAGKNSVVGIDSWSGKFITPQDFQVLKRFANVFEQAYTRFLDLQKSESQAREAQIELALERVRARTMAMQNSEELHETSLILFQQMKELGEPVEQLTIGVVKETENVVEIFATIHGSQLQQSFLHSIDEMVMNKIYRGWKAQQKSLLVEMNSDEIQVYNRYRNELVKSEMFSTTLSKDDRRIIYAAYFSKGMLALGSNTPLSEESHRLLERFAGVFDGIYTRFLDLQKAEAQAREAKIEAALEKVRSRSLAMHKSEDLQDVVHTIFEKLKELDVDFYTAIIILFEEGSKDVLWWLKSKANEQYQKILIPYADISYLKEINKARENRIDFFSKSFLFEEKNQLFRYLFAHTDLKHVPQQQQEFLLGTDFATISVSLSQNTGIHVSSYSKRSFSEQDNDVFIRFSKVFDQAYTRFLDLQKAEVQAREAQIELALERVRARTMAMQKSEELADAAQLLYQEFGTLGINSFSCGYMFIDEVKKTQTAWVVLPDGVLLPNFIVFPLTGDHVLDSRYKDWKEKKPLHIYEIQGEVNREHHRFLSKYVPPFVVQDIFSKMPDRIVFHCPNFSVGYLLILATEFFSTEEQQTIIRFAKVFEMTYTRFLDLQKAEAQAREAQIQLALERVRSKAMAMHHSDELDEVLAVLCEQFDVLGILPMSTHMTVFNLENNTFTFRETGKFGDRSFGEQTVDLNAMDTWKETVDKWKESKALSINLLHFPKETLPQVWEVFHESFASMPEGSRITTDDYPDGIYHTAGKHPFGYIGMNQTRKATEEEEQIVIKFANEFGIAYQRFLDLQKAEAQAREAYIEAALERVRSRTMAMQHSDELQDTALLLFQQVRALSLSSFAAGFNIWDDDGKAATAWMATENSLQPPFKTSSTEDIFLPIHQSAYRGESLFVKEQRGDELETHYRYMASIPIFKTIMEKWVQTGVSVPTFQIMHCAFFSHGYLLFISHEPVPEAYDIFKRFAKVFEQTYTRFLDLQKAEAQAREAKIETGLERVRGVAMSMRKPDELLNISETLFKQLITLEFTDLRNTEIFINNDAKQTITSYHYSDYGITGINVEDYTTSPTMQEWTNQIRKDDGAFVELIIPANEMDEWRKHREEMGYLPDPKLNEAKTICYYAYSIGLGALSISTFQPVTAEQIKILDRFRNVFDLSYKRYSDISLAEAQAREAQIELGLERVRAKAMAMQSSSELAELVDTLFRELTKLDLLLDRCLIMLYEPVTNDSTWWIAAPESNALPIGIFVKYHEYAPYLAYIDAWHKRILKWRYVLEGTTKKEWDNFIFTETKMALLPKAVKEGMKSFEKIFLNVSFNNFGSLTASSFETLPEEQFEILLRFAKVFDSTYTRFNDLQKAEALAREAKAHLIQIEEEKLRAETALQELQATQTQLIQSEKMASLGELTAGIAHEIQNPLNFVNNFSEVNTELIEELKTELESGNMHQAIELANDIKANEQKINHHGKRADVIVKGMLQHSRSSNGVKEPTDINVLADEYVRLSYHGLRAKDKSFNATIKTDFDNSIGNIKIIPQDIGRVVLNLLTNAFYAVDEKKKSGTENYEPTVSVSTKKVGDKVAIKVSDNGNGIPQKVLDKIFQPFFTTKPTGQGTGLGLSLSYDIIKAHGGDIKVETKEGVGSEFIIQLPAYST